MVVLNVIFFFIIRGPNANIYLGISIFSILSLIGIVFAILSRKLPFIVFGIFFNGVVLLFAYFLLMAMGIGEA
ncbi:hypothetical protein J5Y03_14095 [Bacillus sp. RG28]|uniref:Uncharacterized protein n=1 Tax=Gottfriedia endophytica TaxID=2820819 RepID=A0A940SLG7_9BACI|nr:hypothetical protein [Gottfriedia endophytica]MBP0726288.1 hypothetical protein [Gottfriedia endophytica]